MQRKKIMRNSGSPTQQAAEELGVWGVIGQNQPSEESGMNMII
jgi:hypothetical protein